MLVLARKGSINLVKYDNGMYAVDKITKAIGMNIFASNDKEKVVEFFADKIKSVRRGKDDINLEIYGM